MRLSVLALAIFVVSVTVGELITFESPKCTKFESLTFKMKIKDIENLDEKLASGLILSA